MLPRRIKAIAFMSPIINVQSIATSSVHSVPGRQHETLRGLHSRAEHPRRLSKSAKASLAPLLFSHFPLNLKRDNRVFS